MGWMYRCELSGLTAELSCPSRDSPYRPTHFRARTPTTRQGGRGSFNAVLAAAHISGDVWLGKTPCPSSPPTCPAHPTPPAKARQRSPAVCSPGLARPESAQRFALHLRRVAQRSGVGCKRVLGGDLCFTGHALPRAHLQAFPIIICDNPSRFPNIRCNLFKCISCLVFGFLFGLSTRKNETSRKMCKPFEGQILWMAVGIPSEVFVITGTCLACVAYGGSPLGNPHLWG